MELENTISGNEVVENEIIEENTTADTADTETDIAKDIPQTGNEGSENGDVSSEILEDNTDESVSDGDYDPVWNNGFPSVSGNNVYNLEVGIPEEVPFWEKPLKEYSVSEGLLLLIFISLVVAFVYNALKG